MKKLFFFAALLVSVSVFTGCDDDDEPTCNTEDLEDVLSGKTWRVEGTDDVLVFNADGTLVDDGGVFTPQVTNSKSWAAFGADSFSASYITGSGSGSFSTTASMVECDRVVLPDFGGDVVLIRQ
ncbi:MAG: hypothetical protein AAF798_10590 [Bacteroidota bacterium]